MNIRLLVLTILFLLCDLVAARVAVIPIQGSIGPATADYLARSIASSQHADLILIQLDTPGGLDSATHQMVQDILASNVPVVVYVAPNGARAASAGTFLVYASNVAAMAPGTHLGAASPVSLMGQSTMDKKIANDALAYIRTLAELRERNIGFAEKAVRDAAVMTAPEALAAGVINIIANDRSELLAKLDGLNVTQHGRQIKLRTANAEIDTLEPDWRVRFLMVITDPTIAYLLLLLGIYGIFFELLNPGYIAPGVIGGVSMLFALYALHLLPINYAGLALILLGVLFLVAEAFIPAFGSLGLGGTVAFILGSILLINSEQGADQIAWSAIGAMAVANVVVLVSVLGMGIKARRKPLQHGTVVLIGAYGRTLGMLNPEGQAVIRGEIWNVRAKRPINADQLVKVVAAEGLWLEVEDVIEPKDH